MKVTTSQQHQKAQETKTKTKKLGVCFSKEMQDTHHKDYKMVNKTQLNIKCPGFVNQNCWDVTWCLTPFSQAGWIIAGAFWVCMWEWSRQDLYDLEHWVGQTHPVGSHNPVDRKSRHNRKRKKMVSTVPPAEVCALLLQPPQGLTLDIGFRLVELWTLTLGPAALPNSNPLTTVWWPQC